MMSFSEQLNKWGIKITFFLYALGFFIHNAYLMKFGFVEFDLLQTRYVLTGFAALLYFLVGLMVVVFRLNLNDPSRNLEPINFLSWLLRFPLVCHILCLIFLPGRDYFRVSALKLFGPFLGPSIMWFVTTFSGLYLSALLLILMGFFPSLKYVVIRVFKTIFAITTLLYIAILYIATQYYPDVKELFWFAAIPFAIATGGMLMLRDMQKGFRFQSQPIHLDNPALVKKLDNYYSFIGLFFCLSFFAYQYSAEIYPRILPSLGGAWPTRAEVFINSDTLHTNIIYENSQWFLIRDSDTSRTIRLKHDLVTKVIMDKH